MTSLVRVLIATLLLWGFATFSAAVALTPRVAICGRVPDQVPEGIAAYSIAPVALIGCAGAVIGTNAFFEMPGEALSALPNHATLVLPLTAPPGDDCVRIAVDAQGNPLAVVVPRRATTSPAVSSPSTPVMSLPNTSTSDGR